MQKPKLGDLLVDARLITQNQLDDALDRQQKTGLKLGRLLIDSGFVDEDEMLSTLSAQLDIPFVDIQQEQYRYEDVRLLDELVARRLRVMVLARSDNSITLGMADPGNIFSLDEVAGHFDLPIEPVLVRESDLLDVMDMAYGGSAQIHSLAKALDSELKQDALVLEDMTHSADEQEAPVFQLLYTILEEALEFGASDIHIEPDEQLLRIRLRVDGQLNEKTVAEIRIIPALVVRLKLMAGLDISEKRLPQDGRFQISIQHKNVDIRLSTIPVQFGESVVMRLLVQEGAIKNLASLGMNPQQLSSFRSAFRQANGLVLVTGPTGSGKTTSLYAALSELNTSSKKIITIEDPVEYRLERLNQVQINEKISLGFPEVLRASLRQDPDVLLVGEIRDTESANIALRAAMTGHMVLSTLHTNDAPSAALRLLDMGVDAYLVASALRFVVAQRLLRCLCEQCKSVDKNPSLPVSVAAQQSDVFYKAQGCSQCMHTGYRGRVGVFELLEMSAPMQQALLQGNLERFIHLCQQQESYNTLTSHALELARTGKTSLFEVAGLTTQGNVAISG